LCPSLTPAAGALKVAKKPSPHPPPPGGLEPDHVCVGAVVESPIRMKKGGLLSASVVGRAMVVEKRRESMVTKIVWVRNIMSG